MAAGKLGAAVELVGVVVVALVVACSAAEDMYIQFSSSGSDVEVFSGKSSDNVVEGFGIGKVFDHPVTSGPSASSTVLGRASCSWTAGASTPATASPSKAPGCRASPTGLLNSLRGSVVLAKENNDTYKVVVSEIAPPGFQSFLASRAFNTHTSA